jgi:hypothetical protein
MAFSLSSMQLRGRGEHIHECLSLIDDMLVPLDCEGDKKFGPPTRRIKGRIALIAGELNEGSNQRAQRNNANQEEAPEKAAVMQAWHLEARADDPGLQVGLIATGHGKFSRELRAPINRSGYHGDGWDRAGRRLQRLQPCC